MEQIQKMKLKEALDGFSKQRYYEICGLSHRTFNENHNVRYCDLPPVNQLGIKRIIEGLFMASKMIHCYEATYVKDILKENAVYLNTFYEECGLPDSFRKHYNSNPSRDFQIKHTIYKKLNQLFDYVNEC